MQALGEHALARPQGADEQNVIYSLIFSLEEQTLTVDTVDDDSLI